MKHGKLQAKDIGEFTFITAVAFSQLMRKGHCHSWDLSQLLPFPFSVIKAKSAAMVKRGLIYGCGKGNQCNCRGDFSLTEKSLILMKDVLNIDPQLLIGL